MIHPTVTLTSYRSHSSNQLPQQQAHAAISTNNPVISQTVSLITYQLGKKLPLTDVGPAALV